MFTLQLRALKAPSDGKSLTFATKGKKIFKVLHRF